MKRTVFFLLAFTAILLSVKADNITVNGTQRSYIVYKPNNLGQNRPMLISCHGANQDANYMKNTQMKMEAVADSAKFLIVFPDGIDRQWDINGDRDINFVLALIDRMATLYKIDRNCVYLSGFSMGGMFTYHAMNKIADKIAAFAPISGYPLWGTTAASSRPVPILHTQGLADDVCSPDGVRPVLQKWIAYNHCNSTPKVTNRYRGYNHAKMTVWGDGDDGVEVRLLELEGKGHWVSNDGLITGDEIWRFCKRYSLNKTSPNISITSPKSGLNYTCFAPRNEAVFPDITMTATADDSNGKVVKVDFYDGATLMGTVEKAPYRFVFTGLSSGKHTLKAVATDNDDETATASVEVSMQAPQSLTFSSVFNEANALPAGWATFDSQEKRTGYSSGYSQGCRVLQFTGSSRGLDYGLYIRNIDGKEHEGWAKYGLEDAGSTLTLSPGHYTMRYKICNWNNPEFEPVEISVEKQPGGEAVVIHTFTPTLNIGNNASNNFGSLRLQTYEFDIEEQGNYVLAFYTAPVGWADCIIGQLMLTANSYVSTDIRGIQTTSSADSAGFFDLQGRKIDQPSSPGIYIRNGKKILVK